MNRVQQSIFEEEILSHLDAAYNMARWLTRNEQDAEDVVQEAFLRAYKFFDGFKGGNGRAWLLSIVRNTCYSWLKKNRHQEASFDDELHGGVSEQLNPETLVLQTIDQALLKESIEKLPVEFREVFVLRELEGLSYKEIGEIIEIPPGTVMSRLARARTKLEEHLAPKMRG